MLAKMRYGSSNHAGHEVITLDMVIQFVCIAILVDLKNRMNIQDFSRDAKVRSVSVVDAHGLTGANLMRS